MSNTPSNKAIAYYRVSTQKQGASGLGLEAQRSSVEAYARANGLDIVAEFTEIETGTRKRKRKEIYKAMSETQRVNGVLLIAKLDRLARNVHFISGLMESGVNFVAVDMPNVTKLTLHILAAVAEEEARLISARTKEALESARKRGVKLGAPQNMTPEAQRAGATANKERAIEAYNSDIDYIRILRDEKHLSYRAIAEKLNARKKSTRKGKEFKAMTVKRLLDRADKAVM